MSDQGDNVDTTLSIIEKAIARRGEDKWRERVRKVFAGVHDLMPVSKRDPFASLPQDIADDLRAIEARVIESGLTAAAESEIQNFVEQLTKEPKDDPNEALKRVGRVGIERQWIPSTPSWPSPTNQPSLGQNGNAVTYLGNEVVKQGH